MELLKTILAARHYLNLYAVVHLPDLLVTLNDLNLELFIYIFIKLSLFLRLSKQYFLLFLVFLEFPL